MTKAKVVRRQQQAARPKSRKMPAFTRPPAALVETFQRAIGELPDVQPRPMFGYPAAFTRTQMFASLFQDKMILRLSEADRAALARDGARPFEPMPGRPMREYVVVPDAVRASPATLRAWLTKAHAYAASLPPKKKR
jgi:TfoX/Sxy family transcriptional regulator of competence genes